MVMHIILPHIPFVILHPKHYGCGRGNLIGHEHLLTIVFLRLIPRVGNKVGVQGVIRGEVSHVDGVTSHKETAIHEPHQHDKANGPSSWVWSNDWLKLDLCETPQGTRCHFGFSLSPPSLEKNII